MARTLPFQRSPQAARAFLARVLLLPIPRKDADDLSLTAYIALDALRSGNGWIEGAQHLTETMLLSRFMAEAGQGAFEPEALVACDIALGKVFESGRLTGRWAVHAADYEWLAAVVSLYDWQLRTAPMGVLSAAGERLERFKTGDDGPQPVKRRA